MGDHEGEPLIVEKQSLINTIDYQRDIAPYRFIEIYAGVGAGKNGLIEAFAKGEVPNAPKMRTLLITSRRAKVDETYDLYFDKDNESLSLFKKKIGEAWDVMDLNGEHHLATIGNTICTSAFIAGYLRQVYRADDRRTHIWDLYDMIVIDEVHSLILDATYQESLFHVFDLVNHFIERCVSDKYPDPICKHLITMTGTYDPIARYFPDSQIESVFLNRIDECFNVQPKNVRFIENNRIADLLKNVIQDQKRCVYFANSIKQIEEIFWNDELPREKMVVSYADVEKRQKLKDRDSQAFSDMEETETSIREENVIPDRFSVFLTTSKYREGVNIWSPFDVMIVESHNKSEVIQMAGRVRSGAKDLYLVTNAAPYPIDYIEDALERKVDYLQIDYRKRKDRMSPLNALINEISPDQMTRFVNMVESKYPYLRYSYIYNCFLWYETKEAGEDYKREQNQKWYAARQKKELQKYVEDWFPEAEIHAYVSEDERKRSESVELLRELGIVVGDNFSEETYKDLKKRLAEIWGYKQVNRCLGFFLPHHKCKRAQKHNSGHKIVEIVENT